MGLPLEVAILVVFSSESSRGILHKPLLIEKDPAICSTDDDAILPNRRSEKPTDKKSWEYIVKSGVAGGLAGCAAKTFVAPLDRVKILFQTSNPQFAKYSGHWTGVLVAMKSIYVEDGVRGLFRGHSATLLRIYPYAGIKFLAYEQIRARVIPTAADETHIRRFLSGSLAGCASVFFTYPLEVIRVRLAFETKKGTRTTLGSICQKIYRERPRIALPTAHHLDTSSVKRAAVTAAETTAATLARATPSTGLVNFYRGFTATLWGMIPYAGASFLVHDHMKDMLRHPSLAERTALPPTSPTEPRQLKAWAQLTAGGVAGFVSQTVSYPLEVVRRRMQVGGVVGDGHRLSMREVSKLVWKERGFRGFFVGLGIGYVKVVPMVAVSFFVYERAKFWLGIYG
ncbi:mitochondrial carrier [Tothia fuscella]|uniref:Mitochondrial thiamine pyrophosphate carrier 1 n=1 Tax=Tothia fuscella TaxID=1048955 RepID=A0A9P4NNC0_9PEZI|nr:mitochondrial carrier [Tothia fuscella]